MSEDKITEKIYCYDHPSTYNNDNNGLTMAAMMNGGMNGQWNNPLA